MLVFFFLFVTFFVKFWFSNIQTLVFVGLLYVRVEAPERVIVWHSFKMITSLSMFSGDRNPYKYDKISQLTQIFTGPSPEFHGADANVGHAKVHARAAILTGIAVTNGCRTGV